MNGTTFSDNSIPKINKLSKFVLENPCSDFYRNKYKGLGIKEIRSYEDFKRIPFLTKEEILSVPLEKRIFTDRKGISFFTVSSGTTSHNKPAIIPKPPLEYDYTFKFTFDEKQFKELGVSCVIILWPPSSGAYFRYLKIPKKHTVIIPGDINNLKLMAGASKEIKIQGIITTATVLDFFIKELEKTGFDLNEIKWISLSGEFCSAQRLAYFKFKLPNAYIDLRFGSAEAGHIGYRCEYLAGNDSPNIFHPAPFALLEAINNKGEVVPDGGTGELAYTDLETKVLPLIRYKTNDMGSLTNYSCACKNNSIITLGGRSNFDILKFYGITLNVQAIENSLDPVRKMIENGFQMHVFEEKTENGLRPKLKLHLVLKERFKESQRSPSDKKNLEDRISSGLYLSAKTTLKQLADRNIFLPLEILFADSWPKDQVKSKNIIPHLE